MKKFFLFAVATTMMMASCSTNDEVVATVENQTNVSELEEIALSSNLYVSATTRAEILKEWDNTEVGLFALTHENLFGENWQTQTALDDKNALIYNVKGTVAADNSVTLANAPYYYPRVSARKYAFYGYYPYSEDQVVMNDNELQVNGIFDGQVDILTGKSAVNENGWNASYIRNLRKSDPSSNVTPNITFNHMTTQFQLLMLQGQSYVVSSDKCQIDSVYIVVPNQYTLTIADMNLKNAEPTIAYANNLEAKAVVVNVGRPNPADLQANRVGDALESRKVIAWSTKPEDSDKAYYLADPESKYNNLVFAPANKTAYTVYVRFADGTLTHKEFTTSNITMDANGNKDTEFVAGHSYRVVLTINGPEEIAVTATLTPWVSGGDVMLEM